MGMVHKSTHEERGGGVWAYLDVQKERVGEKPALLNMWKG